MKKTRKQKVICIIVSVFLLASFFCIPVSAADDFYTVTFPYPFFDINDDSDLTFDDVKNWFGFVRYKESLDVNDWDDFRRPAESWFMVDSSGARSGFGYSWNWPDNYAGQGFVSFMLGRSQFGVTSYSGSDTIWVNPVNLSVVLSEAYSGTTYYRFSFRNVDGNNVGSVVGYSKWVYYATSTVMGGASFDLSIPRTTIEITSPGQYDGLAVFIEFMCSSVSSIGLGMSKTGITFNYGQGSSPNFPSYEPPKGEDEIGGFVDAEEEILESTTEGMDVANDSFNSVGNDLANFSNGLATVGSMLLALTTEIPIIAPIVRISLGLGLFATLFSLTASIIGAADRKAKAEKRKSKKSK